MRLLVVEDDMKLAKLLRRGVRPTGTPSTMHQTSLRRPGWPASSPTTPSCSTSCYPTAADLTSALG